MATATLSHSSARFPVRFNVQPPKPKRRRLPLDKLGGRLFVVALKDDDGKETCWPKFFDNRIDARRAAKEWLPRRGQVSCIVDAQVRQVLAIEFAE